YDRENATCISDDGEKNRREEDDYFFPENFLAQMHINRREHDHGDERTNTAAAFCDLKAPIAVHRTDGSPNGVNCDPAKIAEHFDEADDQELETKGHLLDRPEWDHEKEKRDREYENAGGFATPKVEDASVDKE